MSMKIPLKRQKTVKSKLNYQSLLRYVFQIYAFRQLFRELSFKKKRNSFHASFVSKITFFSFFISSFNLSLIPAILLTRSFLDSISY